MTFSKEGDNWTVIWNFMDFLNLNLSIIRLKFKKSIEKKFSNAVTVLLKMFKVQLRKFAFVLRTGQLEVTNLTNRYN